VAGTATAALLLARLTTKPPLDAVELSVTVQTSAPDPVRDELVQESALRAAGELVVPEPLKLTMVVPLGVALLVMIIWPDAVPAASGVNRTFKL
jgi:hypothetical protein